MPRPIDLVGKRVVVTLSGAVDLTIDGQELEGAILRLAPDHEDPEVGRSPLKELAAKLLESDLDRLLVSHS